MLELHNRQGGIMTKSMNSDYHSSHVIELVKNRQRLDQDLIQKANIHQRDKAYRNALYWAIKNKSLHNMEILIKHGTSLMVTPKTHALFYTISCNNIEGLLFLIRKSININTQNNQGETPLMKAIEKECMISVQYLLAYGADLYLMDDNHDMAIDYAERCKNKKIFEFVYYKEKYEKSKEIEADCSGCAIAQQSLCAIKKEF